MRIFYYCYGSTHSSVVAASIHLGLLPVERIPNSNEIKHLPYYDKVETSEIGTPFYMGKDEFNSEIFILGMANHRKIIKKAILSFLEHSGSDPRDLLMIDTLKNVNRYSAKIRKLHFLSKQCKNEGTNDDKFNLT